MNILAKKMSFIDSFGFVFHLFGLAALIYILVLIRVWISELAHSTMGTNVLPCDTNFPLHPEAFEVPKAKNLWLVQERWNNHIKEAKYEKIHFFSCGQYSFKIMRTPNNQLMTKSESLLKHCLLVFFFLA